MSPIQTRVRAPARSSYAATSIHVVIAQVLQAILLSQLIEIENKRELHEILRDF